MRGVIATISLSLFALVLAVPAHASSFGIPEVVDPSDAPSVEAPTNLRVVESRAQAITLRWNSGYRTILADAADAGEEYVVKVIQKKTGDAVYSGTLADSELTIEGLDDNAAYEATVQSVRGGVVSEPLETVARTAPKRVATLKKTSVSKKSVPRDVISNKPLNPRDSASGGKYTALLKWAGSEGKIRYYTVNIYIKGGTEPIQTVKSKKLRKRVEGLKAGRYYQYEVVAHFNDTYASNPSPRKKFWVGKKAKKKKK